METQEIIGTFTGHLGPVFSLMWSPLDPDYLVSGSADFTVQIWKISDQEAIMPTEKTSRKVKTKKKKNHLDKCLKSNENDEEMTKMKTSESQNSIEKKSNSKKDSKKRAYFSVYSKRLNNKSCVLASIKTLLKSMKGENEEMETRKEIEEKEGSEEETIEKKTEEKIEIGEKMGIREKIETKEKSETKGNIKTKENNEKTEFRDDDEDVENAETNVPSIFAGKEQVLDIIKEESKIIFQLKYYLIT